MDIHPIWPLPTDKQHHFSLRPIGGHSSFLLFYNLARVFALKRTKVGKELTTDLSKRFPYRISTFPSGKLFSFCKNRFSLVRGRWVCGKTWTQILISTSQIMKPNTAFISGTSPSYVQTSPTSHPTRLCFSISGSGSSASRSPSSLPSTPTTNLSRTPEKKMSKLSETNLIDFSGICTTKATVSSYGQTGHRNSPTWTTSKLKNVFCNR